MNCYIQVTYEKGGTKRLESSPNGHPEHIYPSRGWARASLEQYMDSIRNGVKTYNPPVKLEIVIESTGEIYKSFKV